MALEIYRAPGGTPMRQLKANPEAKKRVPPGATQKDFPPPEPLYSHSLTAYKWQYPSSSMTSVVPPTAQSTSVPDAPSNP